jgi:hypothetical protein
VGGLSSLAPPEGRSLALRVATVDWHRLRLRLCGGHRHLPPLPPHSRSSVPHLRDRESDPQRVLRIQPRGSSHGRSVTTEDVNPAPQTPPSSPLPPLTSVLSSLRLPLPGELGESVEAVGGCAVRWLLPLLSSSNGRGPHRRRSSPEAVEQGSEPSLRVRLRQESRLSSVAPPSTPPPPPPPSLTSPFPHPASFSVQELLLP